MDYTIILQAFWVIIPVYVANASAVVVGGGIPIDFGKFSKDGKRLLGDGKTWRGLLSGTFIGMTAGFGLVVAVSYINSTDFKFLNLTNFEGFPIMFAIIFSLCFGALIGDISESYFKRRIGRDRGQDWIPFDQIDFILGAIISNFLISCILQILGILKYNWFIENLFPWHVLFLLFITPFIHITANFIHKKLIIPYAKK